MNVRREVTSCFSSNKCGLLTLFRQHKHDAIPRPIESFLSDKDCQNECGNLTKEFTAAVATLL